ncbi:UDP-N-acetylglucosamine 1-carboxyvinyltransferase [Campylobacter fetus]|uniref:UDP-N-acetylglucosamine 1-carboxyvinyltransferase n=1 Tax=Campylobacter fetus subsp. testudinum TaxID=1507806 RepID=A0AAX0HBP1_CAMFE|nr:UDP-N-acetylglucosamine 1-carboxyvinyltransferase [Campylobacter fetus]AGZ81750.1 UDP-N-acetylglucosamine enolpyruvoyl transferase [Campylobacter fetus subsp. testudinum 03-427]AJB45484.1 UDP-N-acetylglucosamine 1-carboxyvinyltransferase [Campylobacter fetus subsp. testudinum]ALV64907.1 UDP-N-acetylglucosamine enolpyruvoyl transferase [Campylobacter fetus subsp. testudinum Sp3]AVK81153.1 UDP-N-acetylglucosamine 1-carboxyvinyltransferase [Campylobacter fetus subsp. testudinum]EAI4321272.1 UD
MDYLEIKGGKKLFGSVYISGAKNAALPLIAMSILAKNDVVIRNIPQVADIKTLVKLLQNLGAVSKFENLDLVINTTTINSTKATYDIVRKMRASILVLGPLLARFGHCEVSLPGGCAIGARPIDLHLNALEKMGANIEIKDGYVIARAKDGLKGANIIFDKITVTGTENIVMAAALAKGTTKILNAAKEPEVVQVCQILNDSGIKIEGIGTNELTIYGSGGELLNLNEICVIPDRIEAGTYLCAAAIAGGEITLRQVEPNHLVSVLGKLSDMGVNFELGDKSIKVISDAKLSPVQIITTEFPGFPTDMQAQFMALACVANGVSTIDERLFENRFMHASELNRMGADIKLNGHIATVSGVSLNGADVMATDLRASSALVLAALVANGTTRVHRIYHLDRGYENLEIKLQNLGADIKRLSE